MEHTTFRNSWWIFSIAAMTAVVIIGIITLLIKPWNLTTTNNNIETPTDVSFEIDDSVSFNLPLPDDTNLYQYREGMTFSQLPETPRMIFQENKVIARLSIGELSDATLTDAIVDSSIQQYLDSDEYVVFALTGEHFPHNNPENYYVITKYAWENAMRPIQLQIYNFIKDSKKQVIYQIDVIYENPNDTIPSAFEIQAYSATDSGKSMNFHIIIYNIKEPNN